MKHTLVAQWILSKPVRPGAQPKWTEMVNIKLNFQKCVYYNLYYGIYTNFNYIIKGKHIDGVDQDGNKHYGFCSEDCPKHVDVPKTNVRSQVRS